MQNALSAARRGERTGGAVAPVLSSANGAAALCAWETPSIDFVRQVVDGATRHVAINEYFEVDARNAVAHE